MSPGKQSQMSGVVHVLQYVAVCCRLLQGVAVDVFRQHVSNVSSEVIVHYHLSCRVLHGVAVCCCMLQDVAGCSHCTQSTVSRVAVCCSVLRCVTGCCRGMQGVAVCSPCIQSVASCGALQCCSVYPRTTLQSTTFGVCNTLQHTATHCNTLQHTATHCNTLQHTASGV